MSVNLTAANPLSGSYVDGGNYTYWPYWPDYIPNPYPLYPNPFPIWPQPVVAPVVYPTVNLDEIRLQMLEARVAELERQNTYLRRRLQRPRRKR